MIVLKAIDYRSEIGLNSVITVRLATLQDTVAITELHRSHVAAWTRISPDGRAVPTPYAALTLYERWQHGGPWLSVETCAVHLHRLLAGAGIPLVAELDGQVLAEAEVYESFEPAPFGHNLELSVIITHADYVRRGLGRALIQYIMQMARLMKCERLSVSNAETPAFYARLGFRQCGSGRGVRLAPQSGRVFYQSVEVTDRDAGQVKGWHMPFGRYRSSRQEWDRLFPQAWAAGMPDLLMGEAEHVRLTITGGQAAILFVRDADDPDSVQGDMHLSCWTSRPLSALMITAIRDWAFRRNYRSLLSYMMHDDLPLLGADSQLREYSQAVYELALS